MSDRRLDSEMGQLDPLYIHAALYTSLYIRTEGWLYRQAPRQQGAQAAEGGCGDGGGGGETQTLNKRDNKRNRRGIRGIEER